MSKRTGKKTNNEILEKISEIENKVESQRKESLIGTEDQLFFGFIISLLILFVTLPINDMASFLQDVFKASPENALSNAGYIKYVGLVIFLVSSVTRYCAVVSHQDLSKRFRFASFECLWMGLNIIILIMTINLISFLSPQIGVSGLSVTFLILTLIFAGMLILERYILKIYAEREFILEDQKPFASVLFLAIMMGIAIALLIEIVALGLGGSFSTIRFFAVYVAITVVIVVVYIKKQHRKKEQKQTQSS